MLKVTLVQTLRVLLPCLLYIFLGKHFPGSVEKIHSSRPQKLVKQHLNRQCKLSPQGTWWSSEQTEKEALFFPYSIKEIFRVNSSGDRSLWKAGAGLTIHSAAETNQIAAERPKSLIKELFPRIRPWRRCTRHPFNCSYERGDAVHFACYVSGNFGIVDVIWDGARRFYTKFYREHWDLTEVPSDIPKETVIVSLSHNKITVLSAGDFVALKNCRELDLGNNLISTIYPGTFYSLNSLVALNLADNKLTTIEPDSFNGLVSLVKLNLQGNYISSLNRNSFGGLSSLKSLNMYNNNFTTLSSDYFIHLPRPLELGLGPTKVQWNCSSLCWLKAEERFHTVVWMDPRVKGCYKCGQYPTGFPLCGNNSNWSMNNQERWVTKFTSWRELQCTEMGL